jgi:guanylate kinase
MEGKLIIFSAPSGSGKTTIVKQILAQFPSIEFSVSACSRKMREGEVHGRDYYFLSPDDFRKRIEANDFVEWEEVYAGSYYGTLRSELERIWQKGHHVAFDVDVKGGLNLKKMFGRRALAIFVMPPSIDELRNRLIARGTETPESIAKRVGKAEEEITHAKDFDFIVVNDKLENAVQEAMGIVSNFLKN